MLDIKYIKVTFNRDSYAEITLYSNLNVNIEKGEFVTSIGSNGSGKSTLLNIICGQVIPDEETIFFKEKNILKLKDFQRFSSISRVYQEPMAGTSPSLTILENLSLALNKRNLFSLRFAVKKQNGNLFH